MNISLLETFSFINTLTLFQNQNSTQASLRNNKVQPRKERSKLWYTMKILMLMLIPIRLWGIYILDLSSDIAQTISLYKNCHGGLSGVSIGIMISSYITTLFYFKFFEQFSWSKSFSYPSIFM